MLLRVLFLLLALGVTLEATLAASQTHQEFRSKLAAAGFKRTQHRVVYDPAYVSIAYPNGDVPEGTGVCTDVIIRAYRALGIDLQKLVHEDMKRNFSKYPKIWGLSRPDTNIDHRRVPNLQTFFKRQGASLPVTQNPKDYQPGDLITWNLHFASGSVLPHIGMVTDQRSADGKRYLVVHNIGRGPELEDILLDLPMGGGRAKKTGHYSVIRS
ncbi:MAG: DUF1287 domain-containing protein [Pseudomonadota bacterium]